MLQGYTSAMFILQGLLLAVRCTWVCVRGCTRTPSVSLYVLAFSMAVCVLWFWERTFFNRGRMFRWSPPAWVSLEPEAWQEWTKMLFIPQECSDLTMALPCWRLLGLSRRREIWGWCSVLGPLGFSVHVLLCSSFFPLISHVGGGQELWFHGHEAKMEITLELRFQDAMKQRHPEQKGRGLKNEENWFPPSFL